MAMIETISPVDGSVYHRVAEQTDKDIAAALQKARTAAQDWAQTSFAQRAALLNALVDAMVAETDTIATEISWQMGRPRSQTPGELRGFAERARHMIAIAESALEPHRPKPKSGFERWIARVPLGVVAVLSPWNYPLLTSVNAIVPALMAGNSVILKPSHQTPLIATQYLAAAQKAGFPDGLLQALFLDHAHTAHLIAAPQIDGVLFTGSVAGGVAVQQAITHKFIPCGLELGGKDPAYVREDAALEYTVEQLVDGAFFNSGQSCCGIERIYVHSSRYNEFVERFAALTRQYRLGNPLAADTNLGPMVKTAATDFVRAQTEEAIAQGARALIDETQFSASRRGTPYLAPQVLIDVNHSMRVMREESFGPVVGIMPVANDEEALRLMNDSDYGLTASLWSTDCQRAAALAPRIATGTVFLNRCDYLDPALAWTGVKNTGRGVTLSALGYEHVTRAQSFHFKLLP